MQRPVSFLKIIENVPLEQVESKVKAKLAEMKDLEKQKYQPITTPMAAIITKVIEKPKDPDRPKLLVLLTTLKSALPAQLQSVWQTHMEKIPEFAKLAVAESKDKTTKSKTSTKMFSHPSPPKENKETNNIAPLLNDFDQTLTEFEKFIKKKQLGTSTERHKLYSELKKLREWIDIHPDQKFYGISALFNFIKIKEEKLPRSVTEQRQGDGTKVLIYNYEMVKTPFHALVSGTKDQIKAFNSPDDIELLKILNNLFTAVDKLSTLIQAEQDKKLTREREIEAKKAMKREKEQPPAAPTKNKGM